jgi:chromosome segregation ATPase
MANLADRKRQHAEQVATLNQQIATHHGELAKLPAQEPEADRLARQEARASIKEGLEYLKILNEAKATSAEIKTKFELTGSPLEGLKAKLYSLMEENSELSMAHSTTANELQRIRETPASQPCPECQASLMIDDGVIVKHSHSVADRDERIIKLEMSLEATSLARRKNQRARDAVTAAISQLEALKGKLEARQKPTFTTPAEVEAELGRLDDEIQAAKVRESIRGSLIAKIDALGKMLESTLIQHQSYVSSLSERHSKAEPLEKVKEKIAKIEAALTSAQDEIFDLTGVLKAERETAQIMYEVRAHADKLEAAREAVASAEVQRQDAEVSSAQARAKLAAALRLKELSDKSAMEAVDQIMAGINVNARNYIDAMFPDDGTVVQLLNKKTLSDGEERAKPSLKVTHKGSNPKGISSFSGGEKMRLALGFQLGLADMYHSPLLMIDEALAWLGLEDKERCLETLRPLAASKLILVVEHGLPDSSVDHVISL